MLSTARAFAVAGAAAVLIAIPSSAFAGGPAEDPAESPDTSLSRVSGVASSGSVQVTVSRSGSSSSGGVFSSSAVRSVPPVCWYGQGPTGYEYYEYWKAGGVARRSPTLDAYAAQGLLHVGFEVHATDSQGHWYETACVMSAPAEFAARFFLEHPAVWVPAGEAEPEVAAEVDPVVLAQVASESMDLPAGTIRWNPDLEGTGATLVGVPTWVWLEDAATTVSVRASLQSGAWAQVDAVLAGVEVSAPGADAVTCPDTGTVWAPRASGTSCAVTFFRSSANQPVRVGQSLPTVTLSAEATWSASWTSWVDATPTVLPGQTVTATAEVPVAEVQALVTTG